MVCGRANHGTLSLEWLSGCSSADGLLGVTEALCHPSSSFCAFVTVSKKEQAGETHLHASGLAGDRDAESLTAHPPRPQRFPLEHGKAPCGVASESGALRGLIP